MTHPVLEFAYMSDGRILAGWSKRDEEGGFHVVGDVTDSCRRLSVERLLNLAKRDPRCPPQTLTEESGRG